MDMKRKGFTIVELLVVFFLIIILLFIAATSFMYSLEKARATEGVVILGVLKSAEIRYFNEHGIFTDSLDDIDVEMDNRSRFFNDPRLYYLNVYFDKAEIASIKRNRISYKFLGEPYTLHITVGGDIWCTDNEDLCKKIGFPVVTP